MVRCMYITSQEMSWWRHQMETFSALLDLCEGNSPATGQFPSQRPVTQSFDFFFFWSPPEHNRDDGDLRRHHGHYDVTVMCAQDWHIFVFSVWLSLPMSFRHRDNRMTAPVTVKQPWRIWVNGSHDFSKNWKHDRSQAKRTKTKCIFHGIYSIVSSWCFWCYKQTTWIRLILSHLTHLFHTPRAHTTPYYHEQCPNIRRRIAPRLLLHTSTYDHAGPVLVCESNRESRDLGRIPRKGSRGCNPICGDPWRGEGYLKL